MSMTKEDYQEWKAHPLTQQFHQYLKDYRADLMERWARGMFSQMNLEAVTRCQMADELSTLDDDSISNFYKGESNVRQD